MIPILLISILENVRSSDKKHTGIPTDEPLYPINLHTALLDAAEKSFGVNHQALEIVKIAFRYVFDGQYPSYLDHSFQYYYALLFKRTLTKAMQANIKDKSIDLDATMEECNEKIKALCNKISKSMWCIHGDISIIVQSPDNHTKTNFMGTVEKIINGQHEFLQSLNDNDQVTSECIRSYITGLTKELEAYRKYNAFFVERFLDTLIQFESVANENFEPIGTSTFLQRLKIKNYESERD